MPSFCDVALPVPLEANFTYRLDGAVPVIGGRVLVPFREQRLTGVVVDLHDRAPSMKAKIVYQVLDAEPVLDAELMKLGQWIAEYYVAPLGEVFRTMLPLAAEFRRARGYRVTQRGIEALHAAAERGSSLRLGGSADEQVRKSQCSITCLIARQCGKRRCARRRARPGPSLMRLPDGSGLSAWICRR
jgi:primosomal protein N' (replication factor Y)